MNLSFLVNISVLENGRITWFHSTIIKKLTYSAGGDNIGARVDKEQFRVWKIKDLTK
jgi:hypothetical protein